MHKTKTPALPLIALAALALVACNRNPDTSTPAALDRASVSARQATARLEPTQGHAVRGTVRFTEEGGKVRVNAELTGLTPGDHGFHVHESGDCSAPDASSAGGHFNPTHQSHAARDAEARHIGDLGNLTADSNGRAQLNYLDPHLTLAGAHSIVGRAVIVHAGRDDLKSQPSGDSGARVACGTIELDRSN